MIAVWIGRLDGRRKFEEETKMATTKVRDYAKLARDIKDALGESNITSATHCTTRLRLILKENPSADVTRKIEQMPAVIQVVQAGGQYQIVIGMHAKDVYEHLAGRPGRKSCVKADKRQSRKQEQIKC